MSNHRLLRRVFVVFALASASVAIPITPTGSTPSSSGCENRNLNQIDKFLECVDGEDAMEHLVALQGFADANGGTRASGTPGYDQSADYVADLLTDAGFSVERQVFDFSLFTENSSWVSVDGNLVATQTMSFSGSEIITNGNVIAVDLDLGLGNSSSSGCEVADFTPHDWSGSNDIALIQRGACAFGTKAINATAAGAEAVIIFNQGNTADPGRQDIIGGTLGEGAIGVVAVLDIAYSDGEAIAMGAGPVGISADTTIVTRTTENIVADLAGVNPNNVVMAGAHLDSVSDGPGIQDNGSGSAALLTVALAMGNNKKYTPQNTLRFAWWGAEESGLIGSDNYVFHPGFGLTQQEYDALALYLNFDMVASPNFIYGVYDADESTFQAPVFVPPGSEALEDLFEAYYTIEGVPYEDTEFSGRSDYQAFIDVGIPASGLFTGAEGIKTPAQESIWGGTAGVQYDPCYHLACDTVDNVSGEALDVNVDAIAYAVYNMAASTEAVNGVVGVDVKGTTPDEVVFDGPQGTFLGGGGLDRHSQATE